MNDMSSTPRDQVLSLRIDQVIVGERHRALDEAAVARLSASIKEIGLRQPISVRVTADGPKLVAGLHRLEAARGLGHFTVPAIAVDDKSLLAELWEIDENLVRSELSPAQKAQHLARRKTIWEELQSGQSSATFGRGHRGFAADTAQTLGEAKSTINHALARAEALGDDINAVVGTSLDKGVELDALARMEPEARAPIIAAARGGERVTARVIDRINVQAHPMLAEIDRFLLSSGMDPKKFGTAVGCDYRLLDDMRNGRTLGSKVESRIRLFLSSQGHKVTLSETGIQPTRQALEEQDANLMAFARREALRLRVDLPAMLVAWTRRGALAYAEERGLVI